MLDGLELYEILMLGLGSLLFLVLLTILIIFVAQKREFKTAFLLFFIVPIVMIAWPGLEKIQINKDGVNLSKAVEEYEKEKTPENEKKLVAAVEDASKRDVDDIDVNKNLSKGHLLLNNDKKAEEIIEKKLAPKAAKDPEIKKITETVAAVKQIKENAAHVETNKKDTTTNNEIKSEVAQLKKLDFAKYVSPKLFIKVDTLTKKVDSMNKKTLIRNLRPLVTRPTAITRPN